MIRECRVHLPTNKYEQPKVHFGSIFGPPREPVPSDALAAMRSIFTETGRDLYLWTNDGDGFGWIPDAGIGGMRFPASDLSIDQFSRVVTNVYRQHDQHPSQLGSPFNVRRRLPNKGSRVWKRVTDHQPGKRFYACADFDLLFPMIQRDVEEKPSLAAALEEGVVTGLLDAVDRTLGYAGWELRIAVGIGQPLWELDGGTPVMTAEIWHGWHEASDRQMVLEL